MREREKGTGLEKERKRCWLQKVRGEEKEGTKEGVLFYLFIYLFCSLVDPGSAEAGQKRQHTPPYSKHRRDSCACCSILDASQLHTGREFGVMKGTYQKNKQTKKIIIKLFHFHFFLSCMFWCMHTCTRALIFRRIETFNSNSLAEK